MCFHYTNENPPKTLFFCFVGFFCWFFFRRISSPFEEQSKDRINATGFGGVECRREKGGEKRKAKGAAKKAKQKNV